MAGNKRLPTQRIDDGQEADRNAISAMRYASLRAQVPALYPVAALCVVVACLAAGPLASAWPAVIVPALYCVVIIARTIAWLRSPAEAPLAFMAATVARSVKMTGALGLAFALWTAWLTHAVPDTQVAPIVLVLFIAEACAAFAMQSTPAAWRMVVGLGLLPLALILASTGQPLDVALAVNLVLLLAFIARNLGRQSIVMAELVRAREAAARDRERAVAAEALAHDLAYLDSLTSLPNRRAMIEDLGGVVGRADGRAFALLVIDLDGFKRVNDTAGHLAGDRVLQEVGARLALLREGGVRAYRLGGDEFALLVDGADVEARCAAVAAQVARVVVAPILVEGTHHRVGASVGVSVYPHDDRTIGGLLQHADAAMYRAKAAARAATAPCRAAA